MNTKINLQQLAKTLAQKKDISQKEAERFLRTFFDAIIQNVTIDKSVKIKGLGTFKLIEVLDRESVNVNTGERIVIPGHSKLSFTPDASLRDLVNKPFADFQTVVINEGTDIEEMERVPKEETPTFSDSLPNGEDEEAETELTPETEAEPEAAPEPIPEPVPEAEPIQDQPEVEPVPEAEPIQGHPEVESVPEAEPVLVLEGTDTDNEAPVAPAKVRTLTGAGKALILGGILFGVLCYFLGYYHVLKPGQAQEETSPLSEDNAFVVSGEDTISTVPVAEEQTILPSEDDEATSKPALNPSIKYQITGTRGTHVMKPGDYLTKIAMQEYGDGEFVRYIIAHNRFPDPNNVPVGYEVLLPELKKAE